MQIVWLKMVPFNFQATESESIYLFDKNLIMAWNQNQFLFSALESESISFFALELKSYYSLGESILGPMVLVIL